MPIPMRVLHVFDHSLPLQSGYAFRSHSILKEQHALGFETVQVTSSKHPPPSDGEGQNGLRFHRTDSGPLASIPGLKQYDVVRSLETRLRKLLAEEPIDVIHAHSPCLVGIAAMRASRVFDLPFVYEMRALWEDASVDHGVSRPNGLRYRAARTLETWILRRADAVVCICDGLKREIVDRGVAPRRVTVVPNAVDLESFTWLRHRDSELAARLGLGSKPAIGFIGSLYGYEGVDLLLKALAQLRSSWPELTLLLVGGGPEETRLRTLAQELGLGDRVLTTGAVPHDQIARYYSLVDLLIYPRQRTRLTELVTPLKPLEAMAQGKLVLASDIGGHRELIRDGETGILFSPDDVGSIAATVDRMIEARSSWPAIVAAARRYVERERNWRQSAARYPGIYAAAIERHARLGRSH